VGDYEHDRDRGHIGCKHFRLDNSCLAFPDEIPDVIFTGQHVAENLLEDDDPDDTFGGRLGDILRN
jgi:hypothetical protein